MLNSSSAGRRTRYERCSIWMIEGMVMTNCDYRWSSLSISHFNPQYPILPLAVSGDSTVPVCRGMWELSARLCALIGYIKKVWKVQTNDFSHGHLHCQVALWVLLMTPVPGNPSESAGLLQVGPAGILGAEQHKGYSRSAAFHTGILIVVTIVRAPFVLVAGPQARLCPLTCNIIQPNRTSA